MGVKSGLPSNYRPDNSDYVTNYKTRLVYTTGLEKCFKNCQCLFCKRERQEREKKNEKKNKSS